MALPVVGVVGAGGLMGAGMVQRLDAQGFTVCMYNRSAEKLPAVAQAQRATTPQQLCRQVEVVVGVLANDAAFEEVFGVEEVVESLRGKLVLQMATLSPACSRRLGERVVAAGGLYLEAPVLGSVPQVLQGQLQIFYAGSVEAQERAAPVLQALGGTLLRVDDTPGKAAALKLAMNQLIPSLTVAFSLSYGICEKEGVDMDLFLQVLGSSALACPQFTKKLPMMRTRDFSSPNFNARNMLKDVSLILQEAEECGLHTAHLRGIQQMYEEVVSTPDADMDYSAVFNVVNPPTPGPSTPHPSSPPDS